MDSCGSPLRFFTVTLTKKALSSAAVLSPLGPGVFCCLLFTDATCVPSWGVAGAGSQLWPCVLTGMLCFLSLGSRCPTRSTTGTPSRWGTGCGRGAWTCRPQPCWRCCPTAWRGSARWRSCRSGRSTSCRSRPSTPSGQGPGARPSEAGRGSQVSPSTENPGNSPLSALLFRF